MNLTRMTRADLSELQGRLQSLATAADVMAEGDLEPEICLTHEETVIRAAPIIGVTPGAAEVADPVLIEIEPRDGFAERIAEDSVRLAHIKERESEYHRAKYADVVAPEGPIASEIPAGQPALTANTMPQPEIRTASEPVENPTAVAQAVVEVGGEGPAEMPMPVAGGNGALWTDTEDATLIAIVVRERRDGNSKSGAYRLAASALGRTSDAVGFRCNAKLAERIKAGLEVSAKGTFRPVAEVEKTIIEQQTSGPSILSSSRDASPDPAAQRPAALNPASATGGAALPAGGEKEAANLLPPAGIGSIPDDVRGLSRTIWQYLSALSVPKNWDGELDLEICEAYGRGAKADHIAADLGLDTKAVTDRYLALTKIIRDDRGHMSIEGQAQLIQVLRRRIAQLREAGR